MDAYISSAKDLFTKNNVLEIVKDKFDSLSWKQQAFLVSAGACGLGGTLLYAKQQHDFQCKLAHLEQKGYYPTDFRTSLYSELSHCDTNDRMNMELSVNGIFVCNNACSFTYSQCIEYWANVAMEFVSFRSVLDYQLNTYFWIECSNDNNIYKKNNKLKETSIKNEIVKDNIAIGNNMTRLQFYDKYGFDVASLVKYIEIDMTINDFMGSKYSGKSSINKKNGIIDTIDDGLMEFISDLLQQEKNEYGIKLQEKWYQDYTKYNKPNWNVIYFNFLNLNKCVVLVQWNHTLCDGILFCQITEKMHKKMYDKHGNNNNVIQSLNSNRSIKKKKNKFNIVNRIFNTVYWYVTIPFSFHNVVFNPSNPKRNCTYPTFGEKLSGKVFIQFGPTISLDVFKKVAKSQNVRVNIYWCGACIFFFVFAIFYNPGLVC